jgi:C-terminal processing protease CtpA/Prc
MTKLRIVSLVVVLLTLAESFSFGAELPNSTPDFKEVYDLIREHLAEVNDVELNRAAVQGLLSTLSPKVSLVGKVEAPRKEPSLVSKASLFDGPIGYIRVSRVGAGLDQAVSKAWQELASTNKLNGLVMDLRYAGGTDYAAAAATADLFARKEQPLLDWGNGMVHSKEKPGNLALPMGVLVNRQTSEAAEALAAILREIGAGLILGSRTAGQAMIAQEYPLKDGDRLRIATAPIQLADGSILSTQGVKPDILVDVPSADEQAYYADPFKELSRAGSLASGGSGPSGPAGVGNRARRPRFNEAELVRERRDGSIADPEQFAGAGASDSEKPVVHDPPLARALDFLKGLSVMRQTRS